MNINDISFKQFIGADFLLENEIAEELYHEHASQMPIIDYHCHLSPEDLANDRQFKTLTEIWLEGDHYKWRAMRANGIEEKFITGNASDEDKFYKWADTVPFTLRNPLYHWTHLELRRYFGINDILNADTARAIYTEATSKLNTKEFSSRNILRKMNVEVVCTTDDPIDSLEHHIKLKKEFEIKVLPTFRPDKAYAAENVPGYLKYIERLSELTGVHIDSFSALIEALEKRILFFHENGCRLSDHGLEQFYYEKVTPSEVNKIFLKVMGGSALAAGELHKFKYAVLIALSKLYHRQGWTQQYHIGAIRNNNERMLRVLGPDTGFDSIGDFSQARTLSQFLSHLDNSDQLAKTILYNLNPSDNETIATMIGNFNHGSVAGKVQFGSGWWFLDQKDGMERQMNTLSNMGLISHFVGMLTDSRSFMSYPRHEYFRRILCNLIGKDVVNGEIPYDIELLSGMIKNICYYNAKNYFNF
ncbi:glucuronate isomerase [Fulvivirga sp. M361]|uniref:glucuronate isomerase n=1 Tax=Fulvivirga sp. M361 TaxID=2594266 RepID=UPI0021039B66|nr:glucuronate isomerase [Fulvivirga sp. M361]